MPMETATGAAEARRISPSLPSRPVAVAARTVRCGASMLAWLPATFCTAAVSSSAANAPETSKGRPGPSKTGPSFSKSERNAPMPFAAANSKSRNAQGSSARKGTPASRLRLLARKTAVAASPPTALESSGTRYRLVRSVPALRPAPILSTPRRAGVRPSTRPRPRRLRHRRRGRAGCSKMRSHLRVSRSPSRQGWLRSPSLHRALLKARRTGPSSPARRPSRV
jgi:hypothetical protein